MKTILSICAGAALCLLVSCSGEQAQTLPYNQGINVIPMPQSLVQHDGYFKPLLRKHVPLPNSLLQR